MTKEFEMSMCGELSYFLGLQITQTDEGIFISQSTYAKQLVKIFEMQTSKPKTIPMSTSCILTRDENGLKVDERLYRGMIGSLLYLTASRPDLCYSVGVYARYQSSPRVLHLTAVKRIIKFVKDWAGSTDDRRSTTGGCFFLGNNLIAWHSKKQTCVDLADEFGDDPLFLSPLVTHGPLASLV
ncbi:PREDICTED: uncharacterized protein LOC109131701, partial [Camelina sativa]|uniref:Uncharacterized protein LOC109131701 n=1 Tax=Camelina sativa TaxID=90675 RepID=A0ABM1RHD1_CAMSA